MSNAQTGGARASAAMQEISEIVKLRQRIHQQTEMFPADTPLSWREQQELAATLPDLSDPHAMRSRFAAFASVATSRFGERRAVFNQLDIAYEHTWGSWNVGQQHDSEIESYLAELQHNDHARRLLGFTALNVFAKNSPHTEKRAHITNVGGEIAEHGFALVTRTRAMARFALRASGQKVELRKISDFALDITAHTPLAETALALLADGATPYVMPPNMGAAEMNTINELLLQNVQAGVEHAITAKNELIPASVTYQLHVVE